MDINIVTKEDLKSTLDAFRQQLLTDLSEVLRSPGITGKKEWLKSDEVKKLLGISTGTLQNLRINDKLTPSKVGGIYYYKLSEIESLLNDKKR